MCTTQNASNYPHYPIKKTHNSCTCFFLHHVLYIEYEQSVSLYTHGIFYFENSISTFSAVYKSELRKFESVISHCIPTLDFSKDQIFQPQQLSSHTTQHKCLSFDDRRIQLFCILWATTLLHTSAKTLVTLMRFKKRKKK